MATDLVGEIEDIEHHLDDAEWASRAEALAHAGGLLVKCPDDATFQRLLALIAQGAKDPKWEVRRAAALALGQTGDGRAGIIIARLEADENRWVRETAARSRRMSEVTGTAPSDPALDQILALIGGPRRRKVSPIDLLNLARRVGEIYYTDLAGETAHQLRTVITGIAGSVDALERRLHELGHEDTSLATLAGRLRERAGFLTRLGDDLSTYGQPPREFTTVNLHEVIEQAIELARTSAKSPAARVDSIVSFDVPEGIVVDGARDSLAQAFSNLIANAVEAIAGNGEVRVTAETPAADVVVVRVEDTGCGMDAQQIQDAPRRYSTSKGGRGGTGLGLPIAYRFIERHHNGRVQIESAPGRGTVVTVELPRTQPRGGVVGGR